MANRVGLRDDWTDILIHWEWYEVAGMELQGSGLVRSCDDGLCLQWIACFNRRTWKSASLSAAVYDWQSSG